MSRDEDSTATSSRRIRTGFPGERYGRLVIVREADPGSLKRHAARRVWVQCDCNSELKTVQLGNLRACTTTSCGCVARANTSARSKTHGMKGTREYNSWQGMLRRCYDLKTDSYSHYGGRGLQVCDRWRGASGFANFFADMGPRPPGCSIDRIDNNGNYEPNNCCWSTLVEQGRNKRNNRRVMHEGVEQCLSAWVEELGVDRDTLRRRLKRSGTLRPD